MDASSSCQLFESCSISLQWLLHQKFNIKGISHLLDDLIFVMYGQWSNQKDDVKMPGQE
jgi:hypothetical protein